MALEKDYLSLAKAGDSEAFIKIFEQYKPIVFKMKGKYYVQELDVDDWQQEGRLVLFQSIQTYAPDRGISLGSFFRMNLERHIYTLLRKQGAVKRKLNHQACSLDERLETVGETVLLSASQSSDIFLDYIQIRSELETYFQSLSAFETRIFTHYLVGNSYKKMALIEGCLELKVRNGLDRARRKLKEVIC